MHRAVGHADLRLAAILGLDAPLFKTPSVCTVAHASVADAVAVAILLDLQEATTMLHLALRTSEHGFALAGPFLGVARAVSRAEATFSTDFAAAAFSFHSPKRRTPSSSAATTTHAVQCHVPTIDQGVDVQRRRTHRRH
jgi:hypothetical protein